MTDIREICDLSDEEFAARSAKIRGGLMQKIRERKEFPDGLALSFAPSTETRDELEEFVAFERECCSSLTWSVRDTSDGLQLEIRGLDPASDLFASLKPDSVSPQAPDPMRPSEQEPLSVPGWRGWLRSLGIGSLLSLTVCCVMPIGVAMVAGAGVAAPLGALDNPWLIAGGGLGFAGLLTLRERRRATAQSAAKGCGC